MAVAASGSCQPPASPAKRRDGQLRAVTRIALVASSYLPRFGGVEEHVYHLARELIGRGHAVVIWAVDQGDEQPPDTEGVLVRYLPVPMPNRSIGGILRWAARFPAATWKWRRAARLDRPEIIDVQCFGANGPYALALTKHTGIPLIYSNHGETFMDAHGTFDTSSLMRNSLGRALSAARAVTSCSAYAAADLARFGAVEPAAVVWNGIDVDAPNAPLEVELPSRYIAGVGRLVANKGFDRLILAYAAAVAHRELDGVDLVLGGDGPERDALERLAHEHGVADRTTFTGTLSRGQVKTLLDGATAHVVPSLVEAFGIVVLEGWRSGVPVLVTDRGGPPEFVTDRVNGLLFDPDDPAALAGLLREVGSDAALRHRLGVAGRASADRFSWRAVADSYEAVFEAATRSPSPKNEEHTRDR